MAQLNIPKEHHRGFAELRSLTEDQARELTSALEETQPTRSRASLYASAASSMESLDRSQLEAVIDTLISLFSLRDSLNVSIPEFVDTVAAMLADSDVDELEFSDSEDREIFTAILSQLLEIERLEITAKAISLVYEQDHILHGGLRVLTDMRPIFNSDPEETALRGAMVTYTLKFDYHEGSNVKELSVSLNARQVDELVNALQRSQSKAENLKQLIQESPIEYIEAE